MAKTVLVFAPHADDAEFNSGGTLAHFINEGARVVVVIITDGCKGSFSMAGEDLAAVRFEEAHRACSVMGIEPPIMLDMADFELDLIPAGYLRERLIYYIRFYHPDILVAEDPYTWDEPHPDHCKVAKAAYEAVHFAHLPTIHPDHFDDGLQPHFVVEKYWYSTHPGRINKVVNIEDTFECKVNALLEHKSQIAFFLEDIFHQARLAGVNFQTVLGSAATDPNIIFRWCVRQQAEAAGRSAGIPLAETFHYERYAPAVEAIFNHTPAD
jgi:LmbE family N-acetylglucosaminyl deacetylase